MPSVRDLRDRIRSLKNTQQITKAMKQVAAAKIRRAEALQKQTRPYADALAAMLRDLIANVGVVDHPYMKSGTASAPTGVILMTADKGLAGAFNANLIRVAEIMQREDPKVMWYPVGIKARNAARRLPQQTMRDWPLQSPDKLTAAQQIAAQVSEDFVSGRISKVVLISPKLVSMMSQKPETRQLLPIVAETTATNAASSGPRAAVEFEPSPELVLSRILPKYLEFTIFAAMLETDASFYAAQLVAMNNATDNAKKLIDQLTVEMNNARQASITKEILEIVGGAEALAG
jgi:F-type H+-transporting ATPase subunit gamma